MGFSIHFLEVQGIQLKLGLGIHFGDSRDSRDSVKTGLGIHFGDSRDSRDSVKKNIGLEHMKPATPISRGGSDFVL